MTTTTTTKYELTDADRKRLDAIARKASGKPKVNDTAWAVACDWFATLPVVPREAAERALGEATEAEADQYSEDYANHADEIFESYRYALNRFVARRRAMLGDAAPVGEPTDREVKPAIADDFRGRTRNALRTRFAECRRHQTRRTDTASYHHNLGIAHACRDVFAEIFPGESIEPSVEPPKAEPTPEPQPTIDVVAELAELRRLIDLMLGNARLLELQGECLDDFRRRLNALESAAQRKPRWRWW